MLAFVKQPLESNLCGQACVAMLLRISLDEAIKMVKKTGLTSLRDLRPAISVDYKIHQSRLKVIRHSVLPDICLVKVTWKRGGSHWVIKYKSQIYDPVRGYMAINQYKQIIAGRMTSYVRLTNKDVSQRTITK